MIVNYDVNPGVAYGTMPNSTGLGDAASTNGYVGMSAKWAAAYDAAYAKNIAAGMTPDAADASAQQSGDAADATQNTPGGVGPADAPVTITAPSTSTLVITGGIIIGACALVYFLLGKK